MNRAIGIELFQISYLLHYRNRTVNAQATAIAEIVLNDDPLPSRPTSDGRVGSELEIVFKSMSSSNLTLVPRGLV